MSGRTIVFVAHPDDTGDDTGDSGYADIDGRQYSNEDVEKELVASIAHGDDEMEKELDKISSIDAVEEGGNVLILPGPQRTAFRLYDIPSGVELCVEFFSSEFSVATSRLEVQSVGEYSTPDHRYLDCMVAALRPGWATFHDVKKALQPLFNVGNIRGIRQLQGSKDDRKVAFVEHPHDAIDETGISGYADIDGHCYSSEVVETRKHTSIIASGDDEMEKQGKKISYIAEGGEVFIAGGRQRTVLRLFDIPSGVELCVVYFADQFSFDPDRPEFQSVQISTSNARFRFLKIIVPGLCAGWVQFHDVRKALQPLFEKGNIRGIEQVRGTKDGRTVVAVHLPDDAKTVARHPGYVSIDGRHYSGKELEEKKFIVITA